MAASFQHSAWFYDRLAGLVYGRAIINTQLYLISHIKPNNKILIVGGGTGWILEEITKRHPSGLSITYVEVAVDMMRLSKKRNTGSNEVFFINDAIENVSIKPDFDIAITPFLFDNFTAQTLAKVFNHIHSLLKPGVLWLNCDFQLTGKWWQAFLLKSMFLFFRTVCGIEANKLPEIAPYFNRMDYKIIGERTFFSGFIVARVYEK
jgi:ubiquinone/menaquinone biosynthesis C-methylase UbiE